MLQYVKQTPRELTKAEIIVNELKFFEDEIESDLDELEKSRVMFSNGKLPEKCKCAIEDPSGIVTHYVTGALYILFSHIVFYSNVLGREHKVFIPHDTITMIAVNEKVIKIETENNQSHILGGFTTEDHKKVVELLKLVHKNLKVTNFNEEEEDYE